MQIQLPDGGLSATADKAVTGLAYKRIDEYVFTHEDDCRTS